MIRYKIDDLGWYQFEWLIQSLLKAELSLAIESWGASRDFGKDAFYAGDLHFSSSKEKDEGPFLFQVKFVSNANAAGARPANAVKAAINSEVERISKRLFKNQIQPPSHYCFYTNAPLTPELRNFIQKELKSILPKVKVHTYSGSDTCDLLDKQERIRRAFPQLLSLRDLDKILSDIVNNDIIARSQGAIDEAKDVIPVFVPTKAYHEALQKLSKHHFVVLEGPPEMGKTAIAWVIALNYILDNYEGYVCNKPDDFFRVFKEGEKQIFIADDAFGRTEYDPSRLKDWEAQLSFVLRRLNKDHLLIWTSRKHILQRALKQMDLQGKAQKFPLPGDVYVDASNLSVQEKSLILYRHAKLADLEDKAKLFLKFYAARIVKQKSFTPERIRRFVAEKLESLAKEFGVQAEHSDKVEKEISEAINNPTDGMRKSFQALTDEYKLLLISLLETQTDPKLTKVEKLYTKHSTQSSPHEFEEILEDLSESFIKIHRY